jgi:EAL domain-containing protein (putative c-di-GMP-specific phosphodiesterase class I)
VRGLDVDAKNLALCRAIVHMAHELGMRVVAEGIEREVERDLLTEIGCDYGQGYLFGRPMPAEDFEQVLSRDATALS